METKTIYAFDTNIDNHPARDTNLQNSHNNATSSHNFVVNGPDLNENSQNPPGNSRGNLENSPANDRTVHRDEIMIQKELADSWSFWCCLNM